MGVIRKLGLTPVISFSQESLNSLGVISGSEPGTPQSETVSADTSPQRPIPSETRVHPALLLPTRFYNSYYTNNSRRAGARKTRRANDARMLHTLAEEENENFTEPNIEDFRPNNSSVFTHLLSNFESMRVWQYFITCSEEEQRNYINVRCQHRANVGPVGGGIRFTQNVDDAESKDADHATPDKRMGNPSYSPEQRFCNVESNLRSVLKKKHLPLGVLSYLEDNVVEIFEDDSKAVYISEQLTSYQRLLLHALCQYNLLHSNSVNIGGVRRTKVENKETNFLTPDLSLTEYIETYYHS